MASGSKLCKLLYTYLIKRGLMKDMAILLAPIIAQWMREHIQARAWSEGIKESFRKVIIRLEEKFA